jgi:hypothetical protein
MKAVFVTIAVHALDGSPETDRLEALANAVAGLLREQAAMRRHTKDLDAEIASTARKAERMATQAKTRAGHRRATADRVIDAARAIHQGVGPLTEPAIDRNQQDGIVGYRRNEATLEVDERPLRVTMRHINTPLVGGEDTTT